jgi:hypothetical protein
MEQSMTDLRLLDDQQLGREAERTLQRMLPRLANALMAQDQANWVIFRERLVRHFPQLFARLTMLYGHHYDFYYHLEQLLIEIGQSWLARIFIVRNTPNGSNHSKCWEPSIMSTCLLGI